MNDTLSVSVAVELLLLCEQRDLAVVNVAGCSSTPASRRPRLVLFTCMLMVLAKQVFFLVASVRVSVCVSLSPCKKMKN